MTPAFQVQRIHLERAREFLDDPLHPERREAIARRRMAAKPPDSPITDAMIWRAMMVCLLTSQQKISPNTPVRKLLDMQRFPFDWVICRRLGNHVLEKMIRNVLFVRRIGKRSRIASYTVVNRAVLAYGKRWARMSVPGAVPTFQLIQQRLFALEQDHTVTKEREFCNYIDAHLKGIGPKQARNFLLNIGMLRHAIPIDIRVWNWINGIFGANGKDALRPIAAFQNEDYYDCVVNSIRNFCEMIEPDLRPVDLDAAIFAESAETGIARPKWKNWDYIKCAQAIPRDPAERRKR